MKPEKFLKAVNERDVTDFMLLFVGMVALLGLVACVAGFLCGVLFACLFLLYLQRVKTRVKGEVK